MTLEDVFSAAAESRAYTVAIDLGTTFVAAALSRAGRQELVTLGHREAVIPSVVFLEADGKPVCGDGALQRSGHHPERAAAGVKRLLGAPSPLRLGEQTRSATEVMATLLEQVLALVAENEHGAPERVVLTHPAHWGPVRLAAFAEVARQAGLDEVMTVAEPVAAAVHYTARREVTEPEVVVVCDLGGGSFDATVLRIGHDRAEIVGVPEGIDELGGVDFDEALYTYVDLECGGPLSRADEHDPDVMIALAQVRRECVLAKRRLSTHADAVIPLVLPERAFEIRVTRAQFEDLIRPRVEPTIGVIERTLHSAGLAVAEVDAVLLVGGSSRIPLVRDMLANGLGCPIITDTHPKYAVALGAAALSAHPTALNDLVVPVPNTIHGATASGEPNDPEPKVPAGWFDETPRWRLAAVGPSNVQNGLGGPARAGRRPEQARPTIRESGTDAATTESTDRPEPARRVKRVFLRAAAGVVVITGLGAGYQLSHGYGLSDSLTRPQSASSTVTAQAPPLDPDPSTLNGSHTSAQPSVTPRSGRLAARTRSVPRDRPSPAKLPATSSNNSTNKKLDGAPANSKKKPKTKIPK